MAKHVFIFCHVEGTFLSYKMIDKNNLPKVVFHSLRHSSITYKLKLNGGDNKSVQGDSGHAQAQMVTDQYSHILDDDRMNNAALFEKAFYSGKGTDRIVELLSKLLANPEMAALLRTLAGAMK